MPSSAMGGHGSPEQRGGKYTPDRPRSNDEPLGKRVGVEVKSRWSILGSITLSGPNGEVLVVLQPGERLAKSACGKFALRRRAKNQFEVTGPKGDAR